MTAPILPDNRNIVQLLAIGQLALAQHAANAAVRSARHLYYDALRNYPGGRDLDAPLDPRDERQAGLIAHSQPAFDAYMAARRAVYNLQRRLDNACRKLPGAAA